MHWLMISNKGRFMAINQEFDLAPQQAIAPSSAPARARWASSPGT